MKQINTLAIAALMALCLSATASSARDGFRAFPLNDTDFEVTPGPRMNVGGYWCAAADYARRHLDAGWQDRIYVLRGYGPSATTGRRTAVQFSMNMPTNVGQQSSVTSGFQPGYSMSVQRANGRCNRSVNLR